MIDLDGKNSFLLVLDLGVYTIVLVNVVVTLFLTLLSPFFSLKVNTTRCSGCYDAFIFGIMFAPMFELNR